MQLDYDRISRLKNAGMSVAPERFLKTDKQIDGCREAGAVNKLVLDAVAKEITVGMSTDDIDRIVVRETKALGGIPACLGFEGYPKSVCTSRNAVVCHGIPDKNEFIREGDIINVDCTTKYNGYFGDASRMFTFGDIGKKAEELVSVTKEAVDLAISHLVPYETHLSDIGYYIGGLAKRHGFSVVREIGGHGVGLEMHEDPYVCHLGFLGRGIVLLPGMIFTIEPMICQGTNKWKVDPKNGWTVTTADRKLSAQVEHEVLITETGYEILSM